MTVLVLLSEDLASAAERQVRSLPPKRRGRRVAAVAALVAIGAGGVAVASGVWSPQVGDDRRGHPTVSPSSPPAEQLRLLGVLRRPATDADRGFQSRYALTFQGPELKGVRTEYVRLLDTQPNGRGYVLIPAEEARGRPDQLCLFAQDVEGGGETCFGTEAIGGGAELVSIANPMVEDADGGPPGRPDPRRKDLGLRMRPSTEDGEVAGLVPDGVAQVQVADRPPVPVRDNFYRAPLPARASSTDVRWLDATGDVIPHG